MSHNQQACVLVPQINNRFMNLHPVTISLFLLFATTSFSQQNQISLSKPGTDYLKKSQNQKKAAWIMLGGGATLVLIGAVIPQGELTDRLSYPCLCRDDHANDGIKAALSLGGIAAMVGSVPLFLASSKNKKRATKASAIIQMERMPVLQTIMVRNQSFPAVGLRIQL
jgi:hypothetical protein